LLETPAHYVDFPWRGANCIQDTAMPDAVPAANVFYDITNTLRRDLHRTYIYKCLDELAGYTNVIHLIGEEYTGPLSFMQFWLDTISQWQRERGRKVKVGLVATKDVTDAILEDPVRGPMVCTICLSYWWYNADGTLHAPPGGKEVPGRYTGELPKHTTPRSLYRQIREYRLKYPNKAIIQHHPVMIERAWAFLMGGGSMIIARMQYADSRPPKKPWQPPDSYIAPDEAKLILPTYNFINEHLSHLLPKMRPQDITANDKDSNWCLSDGIDNYLIFTLTGGPMHLDLSQAPAKSFAAKWFDPRKGALIPATNATITGGRRLSIQAPDEQCWALWLTRNE